MANQSSKNKVVKVVAALAVGTLALVFLSPVLFPVSQPDLSATIVAPELQLGAQVTAAPASTAEPRPVSIIEPTPTPTVVIESADSKDMSAATDLVGASIESNSLGVTSGDLLAKANPKGDGTFVYVQETRFNGVERNLVWMVVESKAFALNSPSKMVTPSLPWPREADDEAWNKTKIDKFSGAGEAIALVY